MKAKQTFEDFYLDNLVYIDNAIDKIYFYFSAFGCEWQHINEPVTRKDIQTFLLELLEDAFKNKTEIESGHIFVRVNKEKPHLEIKFSF